ncbi:MAG: hypothetical protein P9M00_11250 [Candidatus Tritonobacter lacicola]|nr:hypothetical protein [Candidatus Tritonobacter lacicola]
MGRSFTLVAAVIGVCFFCSCLGTISIEYKTRHGEGEEPAVEEEIMVEEIDQSLQMAGAEDAVEVIEEEPIK